MNKADRHMDICKGLNKIYEQKNHDYGDSFHDTFVEEGMAMARIRLSDKLNRFKKLSKADSEQKVNDESIRDTLLDLANYAIMTVMEMDIQAVEEHHNNLMSLGKDSLLNKTFHIPEENFANCGEFVCPKCGNKMTYNLRIDKYLCGGCGTMYSITSNGALLMPVEGIAVDKDEDPCKKCTYPGKATCGGCVDRDEWKKRQRSDTNAYEAEQADGRR